MMGCLWCDSVAAPGSWRADRTWAASSRGHPTSQPMTWLDTPTAMGQYIMAFVFTAKGQLIHTCQGGSGLKKPYGIYNVILNMNLCRELVFNVYSDFKEYTHVITFIPFFNCYLLWSCNNQMEYLWWKIKSGNVHVWLFNYIAAPGYETLLKANLSSNDTN